MDKDQINAITRHMKDITGLLGIILGCLVLNTLHGCYYAGNLDGIKANIHDIKSTRP